MIYMRLRHIITPLAVGLAARALIRHRRTRAAHPAPHASARRPSDAADYPDYPIDPIDPIDPRDPVQSFDSAVELEAEPLAVDAMPVADAEAAEDLAGLEVELDTEADPDAETADEAAERDAEIMSGVPVVEPGRRGDDGELYGAHTPAAADRDHPDDDQAFDDGQNWLEALETSAVESGPEPERDLADIVDDEDVLAPPHASGARDTPVADHGSGGRRGL
jgi:hypothetical protein